MGARASEGLFWDEDFAWEPPSRRASALDVGIPEPEPAVRRPARRPRRPARRRARLRAGLVLLRAGAVLASVASTLALATVVTLGRPAEEASPTRKGAPAATASPRLAAPSAGPVERAIRLGDRGEAVRGLQQTLSALGFDAGAADGAFQGATRDAVVAFQQAHGLAPDGVVGPATREALRAALTERARSEAASARRGLAAAVGARRLSTDARARYDAIVTRSLRNLDGIPLAGAANLSAVLAGIAAHSSAYDEPRALTLFSMLETNARRLAERRPPEKTADVEGRDGVVYRFFPARGFQFHPLANFAALNAHVTRGRSAEARRLAAALVARGVPDEDALLWEYYFPFGGPPRWTSGFAQAVAADALARTGALVGDPSLFEAAKSAFRAIPGRLALELAGGIWIREYGFSDIVILNAQLQTLLSLSRYAETTGDLEARAFAGDLETASRALLPRFDAGCWSLYSLGGGNASPHYHAYHVSLLEQLAAKTGEPPWAEVARRWAGTC